MKKGLGIAWIAAVAACGWWFVRDPGPLAPATSEALAKLDEDVRGPIEAAVERVRAEPANAELRGELAKLYQANGLVDATEAAYLDALVLDPQRAEWWHLLALHRRKQGDLEGAVAACRETIRLDGSYVPAQRALGGLLIDLGETEEARRVFEAARDREADHPANHVGLARVHLQSERWKDAVAALERAVELKPNYGYAHMLLGRAYLGVGEREKARVASSRGKGALPPLFDPWASSLLELRLGYSGAMKESERLYQEGRDEDAIRLLVALRESHPDDAMLLSNLATAYGRLDQVDSMIATLKQSLAAHPDHYPSHLNISHGYLRKGNADLALEHVERALELNPVLSAAHAHRAEVLLVLERPDEARAALEDAIAHKGDATRFRMRLGQVLFDAEDFDGAAATFRSLTELEPSSIKGLHWLSRSALAAGRVDEARAALQRAQQVAPGHRGHAVVEAMIAEEERP